MIEAMKQALEVIETAIKAGDWKVDGACDPDNVIHGLRQAIREHAMYEVQRLGQEIEQEPEAWRYGALLYHDKLDAMEFIRTSGDSYLLEPLYTHPQRTWVGLTNEERMDILLNLHRDKILSHMDTALAIEAKLKERNT